MNTGLPKPKNWDDFEDLCYLLWKFIWNDRNARKNGRQGQAQHGVDIYGTPEKQRKIEGVQCKGKAEWAETKLTIAEIKEELKKATQFTPSIKALTFATTAPSDSVLLEKVRKLDLSNYNNIKPHVQSWNEIEVQIREFPDVLAAFYRDSVTTVKWSRTGTDSFEAEVNIKRPDEEIFNLMKSDMAKMHVNLSLRTSLKNVATEIAFNAAKFAKSKSCIVRLSRNSFSILCDGPYFDLKKYLDDPKSVRKGGMTEIQNLLNSYVSEVNLTSTAVQGGSLYTFNFKNELINITSETEPYELEIGDFVSIWEIYKIEIPVNAKTIKLSLDPKIGNISNLTMLLMQVVPAMPPTAILNLDVSGLSKHVQQYALMSFQKEIRSGKIILKE